MNKVWYIRTVFGMDLICEIDENKSTETEYRLINPLQHAVMPHPTQPGAMRESFIEVTNHSKGAVDVDLQKIHRFLKYEAEDRLKDNYLKAITNLRAQKSGIILATKPPPAGIQL